MTFYSYNFDYHSLVRPPKRDAVMQINVDVISRMLFKKKTFSTILPWLAVLFTVLRDVCAYVIGGGRRHSPDAYARIIDNDVYYRYYLFIFSFVLYIYNNMLAHCVQAPLLVYTPPIPQTTPRPFTWTLFMIIRKTTIVVSSLSSPSHSKICNSRIQKYAWYSCNTIELKFITTFSSYTGVIGACWTARFTVVHSNPNPLFPSRNKPKLNTRIVQ